MSKKNTRERGKRNTDKQQAQEKDATSNALLIALSQFLLLQRDAAYTDLADAAEVVSVKLDTEDKTRWEKLRKKHLRRKRRKSKLHEENITQRPTYLTQAELLDFSTKDLLKQLLLLATQEPTKEELDKAYRPSPLKHTLAQAGPEAIAAMVKKIDFWLQQGNPSQPYADIIDYIRSQHSAYESRRRDATPVEQWTPLDWKIETQQLHRSSDQYRFDFYNPRITQLLTGLSPQRKQQVLQILALQS